MTCGEDTKIRVSPEDPQNPVDFLARISLFSYFSIGVKLERRLLSFFWVSNVKQRTEDPRCRELRADKSHNVIEEKYDEGLQRNVRAIQNR